MSKTGWSMTAAAGLVVVAVAFGATRRAVLGPDIEGGPGWQVTLTVTGGLPGGIKSLSLPLPPEFRRQHISGETFNSRDLVPMIPKRKQRARRVNWRRDGGEDRPLPFTLTYTFRAQIGESQPTPGMLLGSRRLDRTPPDEAYLHPASLIESASMTVQNQAEELLRPLKEAGPEAQLRALFDFVDRLGDGKSRGALHCLQFGKGSDIGRARLLVALCRSRGIHARLLTGVVLSGEGKRPLHSWAEAWVGGHWVALDPTRHHFGADQFPDTYLVLHIGDGGYRTAQGKGVQVDCQVQNLSKSADRPPLASALRTFFRNLSLQRLRPAEQHLVRFLLLLPLAALIVSVYRTLIGVPTFGTFGPALLGLAFLDLRAMRWGLPIFVLIILLGWAMRHGLERFHLLQVPRAAALLTLIVGVLIVLIVVSSSFGVTGTQYVSLFPLVILTHLVERFWTVEAEDGTVSSFKTLLGTMVVSVTVSLALAPDAVGAWMLRYPETLLVALAAQLALGRYTGYRLSELYRFGELMQSESAECGVRSAECEKTGETGAASPPVGEGKAVGAPHSAGRTPQGEEGGA